MSSEPISKWTGALLLEDCVQLMDLLKSTPSLLEQGLERTVVVDWFNEVKKRSTWMGRTALHVAARRGCVKLVEQVLEILKGTQPRHPRFLECLLSVKDFWYELDSLAMTVVNGDFDIFILLADASLLCKANPSNPYGISDESLLDLTTRRQKTRTEQELLLRKVWTITEEAFQTLVPDAKTRLLDKYKVDRDFNFLPWQVYFFHFTFTEKSVTENQDKDLADMRGEIFRMTLNDSVLQDFLPKLQDGQGRSALHVAVDASKNAVEVFFNMFVDDNKVMSSNPQKPSLELEANETKLQIQENSVEGEGKDSEHLNVVGKWRTNWMEARDGGGRTPFHRAVAFEISDVLDSFVANSKRHKDTQVIENYDGTLMGGTLNKLFSVDSLSKRNGLKGGRISLNRHAVHDAIIRKNLDIVKQLCGYELNSPPCVRDVRIDGKLEALNLDTVEFAILVGDATVSQWFLDHEKLAFPSMPSPSKDSKPRSTCMKLMTWIKQYMPQRAQEWSILHIAAARGNLGALKTLLKRQCDPFGIDRNGNTALYHASQGTHIPFHTHLSDYVSCNQVVCLRQQDLNGETQVVDVDERKGCVSLLMQLGLDPWEANDGHMDRERMVSNLPHAFISWWFDKIEKEMKKFSNALNAISVTAALVATASYVGPMQPPMGYGVNVTDQKNELQVEFQLVKVFSICNSLSFFLAVSAIIATLIPNIPVSKQSMAVELRRTRRMVTLAVGLLFPSILFVLVAFGSASIAVLPNDGFWSSKGSTVFGALIALAVVARFFIRLVGNAVRTRL